VSDIDYGRATRRLYWLTVAIAFVASLVGFAYWGRPVGLGLALGGVVSLANLWLWDSLGKMLAGKAGKGSSILAILMAGRLLALFAGGYVIVKYLEVDVLAGVAGLLSSALAALIEIVLEIAVPRRLSL
jgi:ATP synthase I chain.